MTPAERGLHVLKKLKSDGSWFVLEEVHGHSPVLSGTVVVSDEKALVAELLPELRALLADRVRDIYDTQDVAWLTYGDDIGTLACVCVLVVTFLFSEQA